MSYIPPSIKEFSDTPIPVDRSLIDQSARINLFDECIETPDGSLICSSPVFAEIIQPVDRSLVTPDLNALGAVDSCPNVYINPFLLVGGIAAFLFLFGK